MVWLYLSPVPVGRRGYFSRSDDFYLPSLRFYEGGGGGGQHPVCQPMQYCPASTAFTQSIESEAEAMKETEEGNFSMGEKNVSEGAIFRFMNISRLSVHVMSKYI
jgi:hypothetical protein